MLFCLICYFWKFRFSPIIPCNFPGNVGVNERKIQSISPMKNADKPFILLILLAISLLYTVIAYIS
jgi:hypothetical protein